ncbi:MAG: hypothetical protein ACHQAU_03500 [Gammaproteobacteria bacterium]
MKRVAGIVLVGLMVAARAAPSLPPDPSTWRPADLDGPALFVGEVTQVQDFKNPRGVDYACHAVTAGPHKNVSQCISNACGLEQITLKVEQTVQGNTVSKVTLNRVLGEWCTVVVITGRKFLIAVLPDGNWAALEVLDDHGHALALPDISGCLGKVDLPSLLQKAGIDMASAMDPSMDWRSEWAPAAGTDCPGWMPESLDKKALPLAAVLDAWKAKY